MCVHPQQLLDNVNISTGERNLEQKKIQTGARKKSLSAMETEEDKCSTSSLTNLATSFSTLLVVVVNYLG